MTIAGIDQGTTSTRTLTLGSDGELQVVHSAVHRQYYPQPGRVEHDPEELIGNIKACANACGKVDALGIDNQGESCLAWDAVTKEALSPVIVWQDNRTIGEIERLKADGVEVETLTRAGLPLDPYFSASKLGWIVQTLPAAKEAQTRGTLRLGTTDAFFLDRLSGRFVTDVSTASRTSLMNLEHLEWDETLCNIFGVPIECLPQIVATTGDLGFIQTDHCAVPVTASVVDQQASLFGFGCREKGDAKITFGTGAFALAVSGDEIIKQPENGLLPTVAWQLDGEDPVYALDGGVFTASACIEWAKSLGLFNDLSAINKFDMPAAIDCNLAFVPALTGLGCPYWDPRARGIWVGLSLEHSREQLVQSILEGIAFRAGEVIGAMNNCIRMNRSLPIDGGMSKNPYFAQFLANVTGHEICPATQPEITGLGTIQLASKGLGVELQTHSQFDSFSPEPLADNGADKFKQAVTMSRNWAGV